MRDKPIYKPNFEVLNRLAEEGYLRRVISDCERLVLYSYTDKCTYDRKWTKHTLNSRGNVYELETGNVIARTFPKFFNFEELPATRQRGLHKIKNFSVFEKMDGSLGIIYKYKNKWNVNTRGSFSSDQAIKAQQILAEKYNMTDIAQYITLLVEIIYPENKIIVDYGNEEKLVLLSAYDRFSGKELSWEDVCDIATKTGMNIPKKYDFQSIDEVITNQLSLSAHVEGFVLRLADGDRIKFKSKEYLKLARLMNYITPLHFWEHLINGQVSKELLQMLPEEFRNISEDIQKKLETEYRNAYNIVCSQVAEILEQTYRSDNQRKAIGLLMHQYSYANCAFFILDNQWDRIDQYVKNLIRPKGNEFVKYDQSCYVKGLQKRGELS